MLTIIITGASSGIGLETVKVFLSRGWNVIATTRNTKRSSNLQHLAMNNQQLFVLEMDINSDTSVINAFKKIADKYKIIDAVVNNAGFGFAGAVEDFSIEEMKEQYETNVFGVHRVVSALLPYFKKQGIGTIINISSMGGKITFPFFGIYNSTKFAIESYTEALWIELRALGIKVYLIEPGLIETDFYSRSMKFPQKAKASTSSFKYLYDRYLNSPQDLGFKNRSHPKVVAERIYDVVTQKPLKFRHPVGKFAGLILFLRWLLPDEIFMRLVTKLR